MKHLPFRNQEVDALENSLLLLNETEPSFQESRDELRRLVGEWDNYGRNLRKMLAKNAALAMRFQGQWKAIVEVTDDGQARLAVSPQLPSSFSRKDVAVNLFQALVVHPDCVKLGGPCKYDRCGRYYRKNTRRQTSYCSRVHSSKATAKANIMSRLADDRADKLGRARESVAQYEKLKRRRDPWKVFVQRRHPDISLCFLTIAEKRYGLQAPLSV
jgi:hypothetical protein